MCALYADSLLFRIIYCFIYKFLQAGAAALPTVSAPRASGTGLGSMFVVKTVFPCVARHPELPKALQYEPRVDMLQHGYKYAPLNTACWPDWLPTEALFLPQNVGPRHRGGGGAGGGRRRRRGGRRRGRGLSRDGLQGVGACARARDHVSTWAR